LDGSKESPPQEAVKQKNNGDRRQGFKEQLTELVQNFHCRGKGVAAAPLRAVCPPADAKAARIKLEIIASAPATRQIFCSSEHPL
ncbi:MAG TPA: hypothetical protein VI216_02805, partial [Candidatus Acidoferrales bacterium]